MINGRVQEGKSTLAGKVFTSYGGGRRLYIDPNESVRLGTVIRDRASLAYFIFDADKRGVPWVVTYYPETEDLPLELDTIAGSLMKIGKPFCLCVDEFFNFSRTGQVLCQKLVKLIRIRSKFPATIILVSHRPTDIPPAYIATVSRWLTFRQTYKPDLDRLRSDTGCKNADQVQHLKRHNVAYWEGRELEFYDANGEPLKMAK